MVNVQIEPNLFDIDDFLICDKDKQKTIDIIQYLYLYMYRYIYFGRKNIDFFKTNLFVFIIVSSWHMSNEYGK